MPFSGLSAEEIIRLCREYTLFEWSVQSNVKPIPVDRAEGIYFWDTNGKRYIDFNSQLMNVNIGHNNKKVIQAIKNQLDKLVYTSPFHATDVRGLLGKLLAEITPGDLKKSFFTLGGAEANENAVKISRFYTGKHKILARYRSFHGGTAAAITLTGDPRRWPVEPGVPGIIHFLDPFCYRCPFGQLVETCELECAKHLEEVIMYEGAQTIAAVLIETVTGTNGIIVPPKDYLQQVRSICDKNSILLVCDEVMSGFGRCGEWFAVDHWKVTPDIISCAKGLTCAYFPLGAVILSEKIGSYFEDHPFYAGLTCNSHALGCATAIATINVYKEEGLIENARKMGKVLGRELEKLKAKHPSIGDVRYIGLFSMIEFVKNRKTKEPLAPFNAKLEEMGAMSLLDRFLRENGFYSMVRWNNLHLNPPLCITEDQIMEGLSIVDKGLAITDEAVVD
jgi:taurine---2-oxoglutarate transaminase